MVSATGRGELTAKDPLEDRKSEISPSRAPESGGDAAIPRSLMYR